METILAALITGAVTLNFAQRVPVVEEQMKVANHRIADLEANEHERERI